MAEKKLHGKTKMTQLHKSAAIRLRKQSPQHKKTTWCQRNCSAMTKL